MVSDGPMNRSPDGPIYSWCLRSRFCEICNDVAAVKSVYCSAVVPEGGVSGAESSYRHRSAVFVQLRVRTGRVRAGAVWTSGVHTGAINSYLSGHTCPRAQEQRSV